MQELLLSSRHTIPKGQIFPGGAVTGYVVLFLLKTGARLSEAKEKENKEDLKDSEGSNQTVQSS